MSRYDTRVLFTVNRAFHQRMGSDDILALNDSIPPHVLEMDAQAGKRL